MFTLLRHHYPQLRISRFTRYIWLSGPNRASKINVGFGLHNEEARLQLYVTATQVKPTFEHHTLQHAVSRTAMMALTFARLR